MDPTRGDSKALPILPWIFLGSAVVVVAVGMRNLYVDPAVIRIESFARIYRSLGLSDSLMITAVLVLPFAFAVVCGGVVLVLRRHDRPATLLVVGLVALYLYFSGAALGLESGWLRDVVASASLIAVVMFLVAFPTATVVPRWALVAPGSLVVVVLVDPGFAAGLRQVLSDPDRSAGGLALGALVSISGISFAAQAARFRRHSTRAEQYQARWVIAGLLLMLVPPPLVMALSATDAPVGFSGGLVFISVLGSFALPIAVFVAVFRYHLYDLDALISRTITYAIVAVVVGLAYAVPVVALPTFVGDSSSVVAGSTLVAFAVLTPVHRFVRRAADRRFNRSRFDGVREIELLASRLSGETTARDIEAAVSAVVTRTLQPATIASWIPGPAGASGSDR
jgi:hypothetical protein